jgi:hypothetical protein
MGAVRNLYKELKGKAEGKRPRHRWYDIKMGRF